MKAVEWKRIAQPQLHPKEGWGFQGSIAYRLPMRHVLRGFLAEGSSFDKGAYIWRLKVPLFVPATFVTLNYSDRIDRGKFYANDPSPISNRLAVESRNVADEDSVVKFLAELEMREFDRSRAEVTAYANLLTGRNKRALALLRQIQSGAPRAHWEGEVMLRCALIERLILDAGAEAATDQLAVWSGETAAALKLARRE